jgi:hypothetical protein
MTLKKVKASTPSPKVNALVVSDDERRELKTIFSLFNSSFAFFLLPSRNNSANLQNCSGRKLAAIWLGKSNIEGSLLLGSGASFSMPK